MLQQHYSVAVQIPSFRVFAGLRTWAFGFRDWGPNGTGTWKLNRNRVVIWIHIRNLYQATRMQVYRRKGGILRTVYNVVEVRVQQSRKMSSAQSPETLNT